MVNGVPEETTPSSVRPIVYFIGLIAALAGLLFGLDIGVISGALEFIGKEFHVGAVSKQAIVSALLWGAAVGAILSGFLARRFGRKNTILIAALIFALGSLGSALATSVEVLIGVRVFLGFAVGMASFTAPLYLSEMAPQSIRGALISMYQLLITVGIVGAFLSDTYFASYSVIGGMVGGHWRIMLGILTIPATIMFGAILFLPESPRWLVLKGRHEKARHVLRRTRCSLEEAERELKGIQDDLAVQQSGFSLFLGNKNFRRAIFLGIGLQVIQQLTGINVIMYYAPKILQDAGFDTVSEQMWGTVLIGCTNVLATFIAIALVDRVGRKPIMYTGFVVMGLSMCTVGLSFYAGIKQHPTLTFMTVAALLMFIIGFAMSAGPIIWVICSEIYPLSGRDFGVTVSTTTNWIVNGIVGATFLTLLETIGDSNTFLLYGGLEVLFILFFLFFVPETKGVSLERIASNLMAGSKLRNLGRSEDQSSI